MEFRSVGILVDSRIASFQIKNNLMEEKWMEEIKLLDLES
jgi:hypothetical protein